MQLTEIFNQAVQLPASARSVYLDQACGGNLHLRGDVESLLRAHDHSSDFLQGPSERTADFEPVTEREGTVIGPYTLREQIGEGGFGLVFVAEQQQPVRRKVALKVIKPGMDTRAVIARFEAERQALALMDHPNIAKVLDAGTTEAGRPYFVMELVKGAPITEFADDQNLTPRDRLGLFVQVCQAVQHAHQKGIIHRDIKPSNVLVTVIDGVAIPKVIDFGVAKAVGQQLTEKSIYTRFAAMVGTPLYMSPEQADLSGVDVDTRADIYALGVLLYELLTGTTPFAGDRFKKAAFDEIRRIIKEEEPPAPSTRLTSLGETLSKVSARRGTEPGKLAGLIRGELDWIVMKALDKDRARRYETATGLAKDVQRYLTGDTVEACPPTLSYRLRKMYLRHQQKLLVAAAFGILLLTGSAIVVWKWLAERKAHLESAEARTVAEGLAEANLKLANDANIDRGRARSELYRSLVREAQSIRLAGQLGYREAVFDRLQQALHLGVPETDRDELRLEATLAMGNPIGHAPIAINASIASRHRVAGAARAPRMAVWHPDGRITVYDTRNGKPLAVISEELTMKPNAGANPRNTFALLAMNPAGDRIYAADDRSVRIWDAAPGGEWRQTSHHVRVVALCPTPEGMIGVSRESENCLGIWKLDTGVRLKDIPIEPSLNPETSIIVCAVDSAVKLLALCVTQRTDIMQSKLQLLNMETGKIIRQHDIDIYYSMTFTANGRLVCSTPQGLDVYETENLERVLFLSGDFLGGTVPALAPDDMHFAYISVQQNRVRVWNLSSNRPAYEYRVPGPILCLTFADSGRVLCSAGHSGVQLFRTSETPEYVALAGHRAGVTTATFHPDGSELATACKDGVNRVFDANTGMLLRQFSAEPMSQAIAYSSDGRFLASAQEKTGTVQVRNARDGTILAEVKQPVKYNWTVALSPDGRYLAAGGISGMGLWRITTGEKAGKLTMDLEPVTLPTPPSLKWIPQHLAFSPDSSRLAWVVFPFSANDPAKGKVHIWEVGKNQPALQLPRNAAWGVEAVHFFPDSRRLLYVNEQGVAEIWDMEKSPAMITSFPVMYRGDGPPSTNFLHYDLSPDGKKLAINSSSGLGVNLFDTATGKRMMALTELDGTVWWLAWDKSSERLAVCRANGGVGIWNLRAVQTHLASFGLDK